MNWKKIDSNVVKLTGNQTIAGVKTFTSSPIVPKATQSNEAPNLWQVETAIIEATGATDLIDWTFMLWEPCSKWDSLFKEVWPSFAQATTAQNIWDVAGNTRVSIPVIWSGIAGNSLKLALAKADNLWEDLTLRIETDDAGEPSGTLVDANATATIARASLTTSLVDTTITLAWTIILTEWVKYHIVLAQVSDTVDPARYFKVGYSTNNTTTRPLNVFDWTDWGTADNDKFWYVSSDLFTNSLLSKTSATYTYKLPNDIPRFAKANWTIGDYIKCSYLGIADLFTGLEDWGRYFIQDTPWAIWLTYWTNKYIIWLWVWWEWLLIDNELSYQIPWTDTTMASANTQRTVGWDTYVIVKSIKLNNSWFYRVRATLNTSTFTRIKIRKNWVDYWAEAYYTWWWVINYSIDLYFGKWDTCELWAKSAFYNSFQVNWFNLAYSLATNTLTFIPSWSVVID